MDLAVRMALTPYWSGPVKIALDSDDVSSCLNNTAAAILISCNAHIIYIKRHIRQYFFTKFLPFLISHAEYRTLRLLNFCPHILLLPPDCHKDRCGSMS